MDFSAILADPPKPHKSPEDGTPVVLGLHPAALRFIQEHVDASCVTLETGCGLSTVVFAVKGSQHTVIAPSAEEFEIIKAYCRDRGIPTDQVDFIAKPSQQVLPGYASPPLDMVLIDGGHGFPAPYLDWFHTAGKLKTGGFLIVDDVWLWSCEVLRDFLVEQPQWEVVAEYEGRTSVFRKLADGSEWLEWMYQPRVARGGRMQWIDGRHHLAVPEATLTAQFKRVLRDLQRGDFGLVARKIGRRLFG